MKEIKYLISILIFISIILSAQALKASTLQKRNQDISKQLIERYNKLRSKRSLPCIMRDSVIDDVTNEILFDKRYRKSANEYNEDSIRFLFYNKGMMDYKFETKEILDKDTSAGFNAFLLADSSPNIRIGYARYGNKNLLIKTKSYLKYDHGVFIRPLSIRGAVGNSQGMVTKQKSDSAIFFVRTIIPGKYYYHYLNHIPSSSEPIKNKIQYKAKELEIAQPSKIGTSYRHSDLVLISVHTDMYLIVTNETNEIVAILK